MSNDSNNKISEKSPEENTYVFGELKEIILPDVDTHALDFQSGDYIIASFPS